MAKFVGVEYDGELAWINVDAICWFGGNGLGKMEVHFHGGSKPMILDMDPERFANMLPVGYYDPP